jgi:RNA polymerase sigma factor (sigma-70 family)
MFQGITATTPAPAVTTFDISGLTSAKRTPAQTDEKQGSRKSRTGSRPELQYAGSTNNAELSHMPIGENPAGSTDGSQRTEEEALLLKQMANGDQDAFWKLWQTYRGYLFGICAKHAGGMNEEVEDVLSRAMIRAFEKMPAYAARINNPKAWLTRLTINLCVDAFRENKRRSSRTTNIDELGAADGEPVCSVGDSPEEALLRLEVECQLKQALADLPPQVKGPFVLHFVQEMGCEDVGKTFSITAANVRKRIQRARCLLRQTLGPACVSTPAR